MSGSAATVLAGILAALPKIGGRLGDHVYMFSGKMSGKSWDGCSQDAPRCDGCSQLGLGWDLEDDFKWWDRWEVERPRWVHLRFACSLVAAT
eukprot:scaffold99588_cov21-Tisochrysis_lutea.AAC.1